MSWHIATFYRFAPLSNPEATRTRLETRAAEFRLIGLVLVAAEGLNATLSGPRSALVQFLSEVEQLEGFGDLRPHWSEHSGPEAPFRRLRFRLKQELVALGQPHVDPHRYGGVHLKAQEWNARIAQPDTLLIDTRNAFEVGLGSFPTAVNPQTDSFRDFPDWVERTLGDQKERPIAMFCTGGIRCEKASAYMRQAGFQEVYQLSGGILSYLRETPPEANAWRGDCFVFDQRIALNAQLQPAGYVSCTVCRMPLAPAQLDDPRYQAGESCPYCYEQRSAQQRARGAERYRQVQLAGLSHLAPHPQREPGTGRSGP